MNRAPCRADGDVPGHTSAPPNTSTVEHAGAELPRVGMQSGQCRVPEEPLRGDAEQAPPSGPRAPRSVARSASGTLFRLFTTRGPFRRLPRRERQAPPPSRGPTRRWRGSGPRTSCDADPPTVIAGTEFVRPPVRAPLVWVQAVPGPGAGFPEGGARPGPEHPSRWTPTAPCWTSPTWITVGRCGAVSSSGRRGGVLVLRCAVRVPRLRLRPAPLGRSRMPMRGQVADLREDAHHLRRCSSRALSCAEVTHHAVVRRVRDNDRSRSRGRVCVRAGAAGEVESGVPRAGSVRSSRSAASRFALEAMRFTGTAAGPCLALPVSVDPRRRGPQPSSRPPRGIPEGCSHRRRRFVRSSSSSVGERPPPSRRRQAVG